MPRGSTRCRVSVVQYRELPGGMRALHGADPVSEGRYNECGAIHLELAASYRQHCHHHDEHHRIAMIPTAIVCDNAVICHAGSVAGQVSHLRPRQQICVSCSATAIASTAPCLSQYIHRVSSRALFACLVRHKGNTSHFESWESCGQGRPAGSHVAPRQTSRKPCRTRATIQHTVVQLPL